MPQGKQSACQSMPRKPRRLNTNGEPGDPCPPASVDVLHCREQKYILFIAFHNVAKRHFTEKLLKDKAPNFSYLAAVYGLLVVKLVVWAPSKPAAAPRAGADPRGQR